MEFLSNKFTENHLLKNSGFEEKSFDNKNVSLESSLDSFSEANRSSVERSLEKSSFNHLLSKPSEKSLAFRKFNVLNLGSIENSEILAFDNTGSGSFKKLFSSHFF